MGMFAGMDSEQPQSNQNSFGPSNQNSTFDFNTQNTSPSSSGGYTGGYAGDDGMRQIRAPDSGGFMAPTPLPWQQNQVGHDGTTQNGMNRDSWRDAWMSSGTSNNQGMDQWLQQNGGQRMNDAGVVRTPFGEILDMGIAYKSGQGKPGWTDIGMNNAGPSSPFGPGQMQNQVGMNPGQMNPQFLQQLMQMFGSARPVGDSRMHQMGQPQVSNGSMFSGAAPEQMDISPFLSGSRGGMQF